MDACTTVCGMSESPRPQNLRPRRPLRVNWAAFIGTGAVLGFLVGVAFYVTGDAVPNFGMKTSILFLGAFCAMIGALVGGVAGVVADTVVSRR